MKYVQQVRGNWVVRMVVPEELRGIVGQRELVEIGLPSEARAREKSAVKAINAFHAKLTKRAKSGNRWERQASRPCPAQRKSTTDQSSCRTISPAPLP